MFSSFLLTVIHPCLLLSCSFASIPTKAKLARFIKIFVKYIMTRKVGEEAIQTSLRINCLLLLGDYKVFFTRWCLLPRPVKNYAGLAGDIISVRIATMKKIKVNQ